MQNSITNTAAPTCLVLGARGFIGSHLTDALLAHGAHVRAFDRPGIQTVKGAVEDKRPGLTVLEGDLVSTKDIEAALEGVDVCYHLVSTTLPRSSNLDPAYDIETNLLGTLRLLDAAVRQKIKHVVFTSSGGTVYGNPIATPIAETHPTEPTCSYGIMKLAIEKYLALYQQLHGLGSTVFRLANPYGERQRIEASQGAVGVFLGKVLRQETIDIWGDGSIVRDYLHISDVISALLLPTIKPPTSHGMHVFNIGSGQGQSINELIDTIRAVTGQTTDVRYLPGRGFDVPVNVLDISRAKTVWDWQPHITLKAGIARTWQWMQTEYMDKR
ncbi:NAD-dependent epimerase/dehydratase family protein [Curvibacter sp. CHRR-16]|uniref:NAD-dependent epimerase/dehydratase family protein n=1 Tax=Curvibacter sp. CHRR-16 TaxID=2835872 RepID=UPI001BDA1D6B|nr:NAD-dependent epimerase/dehydratase family protein [Curvibacter sp. CHRR-16]MBT0571529.1 NAD-dependent epimerase/dehydratase family protein [Curvibacter sp. CHRR-16]